VASLFLPSAYPRHANKHYLQRLIVIFLQFAPTFIILTISYEGLFYFAFCLCIFSWTRLEHKVYLHTSTPPSPTTTTSTTHRALTLSDTRIALFFFYLIQSAFFSASNIASVSSFSLDAVYRLVPIFDPFSQGALLLLKLMVPFAALSAAFGLLNRRLGVAPSALFMVVMAVSDVMTLSFFYKVRDEGSWLDIGTTISHFVIASLLGVFVAGLELVSGGMVGGVDFEGDGSGSVVGEEKKKDGKVKVGHPGAKKAVGAKENAKEEVKETKEEVET
jgi:phosphatidylinositol glycan class N